MCGVYLDVAALTTAPVLCYHRIGGPLELGVTRVGRSVFARQMKSLARAGWRTLSLAEFAKTRTSYLSPLTFLLTFDDGYASLAEHAYPVLADLGFTATTFLITDYVGKTNDWDVRYTWNRLEHLTWPQIEHWRSRGFHFASHGATHRRLTWLADQDVASELARSREQLVKRLGPDAGTAIAYPFGAVDQRVVECARAAGYELGFGLSLTPRTAAPLVRPSCNWLNEEPRRYRNQLRVPYQRVGENASDGSLVRRNAVHSPRQAVVERVVHVLERLFDAVILEVVLAE